MHKIIRKEIKRRVKDGWWPHMVPTGRAVIEVFYRRDGSERRAEYQMLRSIATPPNSQTPKAPPAPRHPRLTALLEANKHRLPARGKRKARALLAAAGIDPSILR
jgi:hypothetical protein